MDGWRLRQMHVCLCLYEGHISSVPFSLCANQHRFLERRLFLAISIRRRCVNGWPASVSSSPSPPLPFPACSHHSRRPARRLPPARGAGRPRDTRPAARPGKALLGSLSPAAAGEVSVMQIVDGRSSERPDLFLQRPGFVRGGTN